MSRPRQEAQAIRDSRHFPATDRIKSSPTPLSTISSPLDFSEGQTLAESLLRSPPTLLGFEPVFQPGYSTDVGPDAKLLHEQQRAIGSSAKLFQYGIEPEISTSDHVCPSASNKPPVYFDTC